MVLDWMPRLTAQAIESLNLSLSVPTVPEIDRLLSKTVLFRGKKLRPTICFMMGQLVGAPLEELQPYARASEFVHAATLAHDDVIDESPMRRNRPTLNARTTNVRAVLAGDLLLARVMAELSALGRVEIIHDLAKTVEDLVSGEWLQLEARGVIDINRQHLETVARKKTASLMAWSCVTPARWVGASSKIIDASRSLGEALGISFQMIDDILDYNVKGEKPFAQDLREGLVNFVTLEMIESRPELAASIQKVLGRLDPEATETSQVLWPWQAREVEFACHRVRERTRAKLEVADQLILLIAESLPRPDPESVQALRAIVVYLRERVQ